MLLYVERMLRERDDLAGKISRAKKAVSGNTFGMDKHQMILLVEQIKAMESYLEILDERIEYENSKDK